MNKAHLKANRTILLDEGANIVSNIIFAIVTIFIVRGGFQKSPIPERQVLLSGF